MDAHIKMIEVLIMVHMEVTAVVTDPKAGVRSGNI
jgi:hypothetical protein